MKKKTNATERNEEMELEMKVRERDRWRGGKVRESKL